MNVSNVFVRKKELINVFVTSQMVPPPYPKGLPRTLLHVTISVDNETIGVDMYEIQTHQLAKFIRCGAEWDLYEAGNKMEKFDGFTDWLLDKAGYSCTETKRYKRYTSEDKECWDENIEELEFSRDTMIWVEEILSITVHVIPIPHASFLERLKWKFENLLRYIPGIPSVKVDS